MPNLPVFLIAIIAVQATEVPADTCGHLFSNVARKQSPLSALITFDDWSSRIVKGAAEITDLKPAWEWSKRTGFAVLLVGGVGRGLIQTVSNEFKAVPKTKMAPERDSMALRLQESDRDLVISDEGFERFKREVKLDGQWDLVPMSTFLALSRLGGAGIDKIMISPTEVRDLNGGFRQYYMGVLGFNFLSHDQYYYLVRSLPQVWGGKTRTTEALRFMRFKLEFPELSAPEDFSVAMAEIGVLERNFFYLPGGMGSHQEFAKMSYRVQGAEKALQKLFIANHSDLLGTILLLKEAGLLEPIGRGGISIRDTAMNETIVEKFLEKGLSIRDIRLVMKMQVNDIPTIEKIIESLIPSVRLAADFLELFRPTPFNSSDSYKSALGILVRKYQKLFGTLQPSAKEQERFQILLRWTSNFAYRSDQFWFWD